MKKIVSLLIIFLVILSCIECINQVFATSEIIKIMSAANTPVSGGGNTGIGKSINNVIGIIQFTGSGIAIITVTILGIKYILASPADKADVKKSVLPIIIGCILLFGSVNLMAAVEEFSKVLST